MTSAANYQRLGQWKGMDNISDSHSLPEGYLRDIANYDVDNQGRLKARQGHAAKTFNPSNAIVPGSVYNGPNGIYFLDGGDLKVFYATAPATYTTDTITSGLYQEPMDYLLLNNEVYFVSPHNRGKIDQYRRLQDWGVANPQAPVSASVGNGNLEAGDYQIAITHVNKYGEESGTGIAEKISVSANGSLSIIIPQSTIGAGSSTRVYISHVNGEGLFHYTDVPTESESVTIFVNDIDNILTYRLETQFATLAPNGHLIEYHNGRIYVANENVLWFTLPFRYGLYKPSDNFFQFPARISVVKAVTDGIYVVADKTYFITSIDTDGVNQVETVPYGAAEKSGIDLPNKTDVAWWSHKGLIIAGPGGQAQNVFEDHVAVSKYTQGHLLFREQKGLKQIISCMSTVPLSQAQDAQISHQDDEWAADVAARLGFSNIN